MKSLARYWKKHGLAILISFSIVFLLGAFFYLNMTPIERIISSSSNKVPNDTPPTERRSSSTNSSKKESVSDILSNLTFPERKRKKKRKLPQESKGEAECRQSLHRIFGKPFYKVRPEFLINPYTKKPLELDCYNDELKIAVEMQGEGHYHYLPVFHRSYQDFINQQYRDEYKRVRCKEMGIHLIEVPYTVKIEEIEGFIRGKINR